MQNQENVMELEGTIHNGVVVFDGCVEVFFGQFDGCHIGFRVNKR